MKKTSGLWIGLLVGAFGISAFADSAKTVDVQEVKNLLVKRGATWSAKESWVTRLGRDEVKRMLGVQQPPKGRLDYESKGSLRTNTVLDWRNVNGTNWLSPVMNQGNCGSCVAFATVASLEARTSIAAGAPWLRATFSPEQLFACGGGACDQGWMPASAAAFLESDGITDEACMPYTSGSSGVDGSCNQLCGDSASRTTKIAGTDQPSSWFGGSVDAVKSALQNGPLVTTLTVYADFLTYASGVYSHVAGDALGGHAVSIVGFDDNKRAWLVRNSWGQEWGDKGFVWVSWDDTSGVGSETWAFKLSPSSSTIAVTTPSDREYVSGAYTFTTQYKSLTGGSIQFHLTDDSGHVVGTYACSTVIGSSCTAQLDTKTLKEGRYVIYADSGAIRSMSREFFVINSLPKQTLSFSPIAGLDLSQPVTGRPEFDVTATFSPVPIQHVEFRAVDQSGKIVAIKGNDEVLPQMKMGWRTNGITTGTYKIYFHGETRYLGQVYPVDSNSYTITVKN